MCVYIHNPLYLDKNCAKIKKYTTEQKPAEQQNKLWTKLRWPSVTFPWVYTTIIRTVALSLHCYLGNLHNMSNLLFLWMNIRLIK